MPDYLIAGNWKMHGTRDSVHQLLSALTLPEGVDSSSSLKVVVFPPYIFLPQTQHVLRESGIQWGAQDVSDRLSGAYTGQISAAMLKEFGCEYVLIGHSERRQINQESDELVAEKFRMALEVGLTPILCIGETLQQRQADQTMAVLESQLEAVIRVVGIQAFQQAVLAYEPVWAIGSGLAATPETAQEVHASCRQFLAGYDQVVAENISILYGGSVKAENAQALLSQPDINGALIGGASLEAKAFNQVVQYANDLFVVN